MKPSKKSAKKLPPERVDRNGHKRGLVKTTKAQLRAAFEGLAKAYDRPVATNENEVGAWILVQDALAGGWRVEELGPGGRRILPFGPRAHAAGAMHVVIEQLTLAVESAPRRGKGAA